ncbi:MAG: ABC-2 transporter permease [Sarcina sp.]
MSTLKHALKKDFYHLKTSQISFSIAFLLLLIAGVFAAHILSFYIYLFAQTFLISQFVFDAKSKVKYLNFTLPVKKEEIVKARYLSAFIIITGFFVLNLIVLLIYSKVGIYIDANPAILKVIFNDAIFCYCVALVSFAISIPFVYKFYSLFFFVGYGLSYATLFFYLIDGYSRTYISFLPFVLIGFIIFFISMKISIKIYNSKELLK